MTTAATPLLADLDHNLTLSAYALHASPRTTTPLSRPPTPDPRQPLRPHPPRTTRESTCPISYNTHEHHRLRRKPTAIFVGGERDDRLDAGTWPTSPDTHVPFAQIGSPPHTLSSLLPLPPSTPSPRLPAASPSLSSSGTTVQSSPTLTPTGGFGSYFLERSRLDTPGSVGDWSSSSKLGLRRAKRLPHQVKDQWEVHVVVHSSERQSSRAEQAAAAAAPKQPFNFTDPTERPAIEAADVQGRNRAFSEDQSPAFARRSARRQGRGVRFQGVSSESASREGSLRRSQEEGSSSYSLSKYRFPPPPVRGTAGTFGYPQKPTTLHYRGASFDLVNPHASLLLGAPDFETPAEIDCLLDDYFEQTTNMARRLYDDTVAARRHILGPDRTEPDELLTPEPSDHDRRVSPLTNQEEGYVRRLRDERFTPSPVEPEPEPERPLFSPRPLNIRAPPTTTAPTYQSEYDNTAVQHTYFPEPESANTTPPTPEDPFRPHSNPFDLSLNNGEPSVASNSHLHIVPRQVDNAAAERSSSVEARAGFLSTAAESTEEQTTISKLIDQYEYNSEPSESDGDNRNPPFSDEDTLKALEAGRDSLPQSLVEMANLEMSNNTDAFEQNTEQAFQLNFEQEPGSELPTSERTYGDTNQLLGILTSQAANPQTQGTLRKSSSQYQLREVRAGSAAQLTHLHKLDSHDGSIHSGNSEDTARPDLREDSKLDSSYPPLERCRGDIGRGRTLQRDYNSRNRNATLSPDQTLMHLRPDDDHADWITEADTEESRYSQMTANHRPSVESYANTSYYGEENHLSAMSAVGHAPAVPRSLGQAAMQFQRAPSRVRTDDEVVTRAVQSMYRSADSMITTPAMAHHPPPRTTGGMGLPQRQSHYNLWRLMGGSRASRQAPQIAANPPADGRQSRLSMNPFEWFHLPGANDQGPDARELEEMRQNDPTSFRKAVDQAADMVRSNTTGNVRGFERIRSMLPRSATAQAARDNNAIMSGALPQADEDREYLVMANTGNASQPSNASASNASFADSIQPQQAGLSEFLQNNRTIRGSASILNGRAAEDLGEDARRGWAEGQPAAGRWTPTEDPAPNLVVMRDTNMPFPAVPMSVYYEGIHRQNRDRHERWMNGERNVPGYEGRTPPRRIQESHEMVELEPPTATRGPGRRRPRAAMSGQNGLWDLHCNNCSQIYGSPTSNIGDANGAFTDAQLSNRERFWNDGPPRPQYRVESTLSARPTIQAPAISHPGDPGRALLGPNDPRTPRQRDRQDVLSQQYLLRCIWNPYMLVKYARGGYDYKIAAGSNGIVREMGQMYKREATMFALLVGMFYIVVAVGIAAGAGLSLAPKR